MIRQSDRTCYGCGLKQAEPLLIVISVLLPSFLFAGAEQEKPIEDAAAFSVVFLMTHHTINKQVLNGISYDR
jgi:hypothetical protein